jgi:hypothetical protein
MKLRFLSFAAAAATLSSLHSLDARAADLPTPSGKFTFEGQPHIGTVCLTNTTVTNASLFLNGVYYFADGKPYAAVFRPSVFDYDRFTIVVKLLPENKLRPEKTSQGHVLLSPWTVLLAGGESCRWLVLRSNKDGKVELALNNHEFRHAITNLTVTNAQWTTLALTVDLQAKAIGIYANGNQVDRLLLPKDFVLKVMNDEKWKEGDKALTFTDYADGGTFHGLVAGLLTFDAILTGDQVRRLSRSIQTNTNGIGDLR